MVPSPSYNEQDASRTCNGIFDSTMDIMWDSMSVEELGVACVHAQIMVGGL